MRSKRKWRTAAKPKLAVLVNTIAPYRLPIYAGLTEHFDTLVLHGGTEPNRSWDLHVPSDLKTKHVATRQLRVRKQTGVKGIRDTSYVHFNFGLLWSLPRFQPDAIISNELGLRTLLALLYSGVTGVPLWVWWGGTLHSERHISRERRWLRHLLADRVSHWISYGASSTAYLESLGVRSPSIVQIQNCVPAWNVETKPEGAMNWFAGEPAPVLLATGQLIARKGFHTLIEACGRLAKRGKHFTLVLVGSGPERDSLRKQARDAGIQNFQILEHQTQAPLYALYRRADAFVFPTLEDVWGLVVNEALLAGCPVLCSCYAGCADELVPPEQIFDPLSAESFDRALEMAFNGALRAVDPANLMTCEQAARTIAQSVSRRIHAPPLLLRTQ